MTGVPFLDDVISGFIGCCSVWFLFEIGVSWFRSGTRGATDVQDDL